MNIKIFCCCSFLVGLRTYQHPCTSTQVRQELHEILTSVSRVLPEKLKCPPSVSQEIPHILLPHLEVPATSPYPQLSSLYLPIPILEEPFQY